MFSFYSYFMQTLILMGNPFEVDVAICIIEIYTKVLKN